MSCLLCTLCRDLAPTVTPSDNPASVFPRLIISRSYDLSVLYAIPISTLPANTTPAANSPQHSRPMLRAKRTRSRSRSAQIFATSAILKIVVLTMLLLPLYFPPAGDLFDRFSGDFLRNPFGVRHVVLATLRRRPSASTRANTRTSASAASTSAIRCSGPCAREFVIVVAASSGTRTHSSSEE